MFSLLVAETKNVFDLLQYLKILLQMSLLQELLGKGLFRATRIPKTFRGSETTSKQRRFCYIPEPWCYVHNIVAYTELLLLLLCCTELMCSCISLRSLVSVLGRFVCIQLVR